MSGRVSAICIAGRAGVPLVFVESATLEAGGGIVGDRYHARGGTFSEKLQGKLDWELTLIEQEEIDRFNATQMVAYPPGSFRRNVITQGVRLNELVGKQFIVGGALLEGIRLCEPCAHLARLVCAEVVREMVHKAGLRARIVTGAVVRPGDLVQTDPMP
jgi:MOSC domain-containing protein YiiM